MKLLHIYPALAAILDAPRTKPRLTTINDHKAAVWERQSVYMDTKTATSRTREHYTSDYWLELSPNSGIFHNIGGADDDKHMIARLATLPVGKFEEFMNSARELAGDCEAYNSAARKRIEQRRAQAAIDAQACETARKEREALQAVEREKELATALDAFKRGERIAWADFEELCERNGVKMHLRTIGAGRNRITSIGTGNASVSGGNVPEGVWIAVNTLKAALDS